MPILLQVNVVANWGSTGRIAEDIGQLAISKGWESYIAYGRGKPQSQSKLIRIGNDVDMYLHALQSRIFDNHGLSSKNVTRKFINQIEQIKPDVIHLHNIHGYFLNYEILFKFLSQTNIPVVWTMHDCWAFTGHCTHFSYIKCERWRESCFNCLQLDAYPKSYICDRSNVNYNKKKRSFTSLKNVIIVPVSDWLAGLLKYSFFKSYPIHRIYNGIDIQKFAPLDITKQQLGINSKYLLLGVASVWDRKKGLDDFKALFERLSNDYTILLVGLSNEQIKKLPFGIKGIARTNNTRELVAYYSVADAFVNPTWEDTFPTTNLEALACGTPVITYRTGGSVEAIDAKTGVVVEVGDIDMLAKKIEEVCTNKSNKEIRMLCRERALDLYDKKERYEEYWELYNDILKDK